jgi:hypothetical protein
MPENIIENPQLTEKRQRGRPKKVLTADEILALQNRPKRARGRPKKEWTPEELSALQTKEKRQRGRPIKILSPQEEWVLKYAPKKGARGRPQKNYVLHISLPQILERLAKDNPKIEEKLPAIENKMEIIEKKWEQKSVLAASGEPKKVMPEMSWQEFKDKIKIPELPDELPENYLFPVEKEEAGPKTERQAYIKSVRHHLPEFKSHEVPELSPIKAPLVPAADIKYLWEEADQSSVRQKHVREILGFEMPSDAAGPALQADLKTVAKNKKKTDSVRVNLLAHPSPLSVPARSAAFSSSALPARTRGFFFYIFDWPFIQLGKFLYFCWLVITAPFRFLDWVVDRTLKGIWFGLSFIFKQIYKLLTFNVSYLIKFPKFFSGHPAPVAVVNNEKRFSLKPLAGFILTAVIIILPLLAWNAWQAANRTKGDVMGVSTTGINYLQKASDSFSANNLSGAAANFSRAESAFYLAQKQINDLGPITSSLIKLVPSARDGEKLLQAGEYLSASAAKLAAALSIFSAPEISLTDKILFLHQKIGEEKLTIETALQLIESVDENSLPQNAKEKFSSLKNSARNWQGTIAGLQDLLLFAKNVLGGDGPRRYLVIFQNSNELRPTGGFMGSFALVDVDKGRVKKMEIPGGGLYDLKSGSQVLVAAPKPLQIFSPAWQIWNANWFPDWPTSAQKIIWFYENNYGGSSVDGLISLTQDAVSALLKITGPIEMKDYGKTLTAENFTAEIQKSVEVEYDKKENRPKEIISDLAPLLLERLMTLNNVDYAPVLLGLNQALGEEKILFYFTDQNTEDLAKRFGWSGQIHSVAGNQDYLMVVHTNISGGKTDAVIENTVRHQVEVGENGEMIDTVTLTRKHNGSATQLFEGDNNVDYVRFYVPAGSELISTTGFNFNPDYLFKYSAGEQGIAADKTLSEVETNVSLNEATGTRTSSEFGKTVFGNWLQVAPGQERTVEIKYRLPFLFGAAKNDNKIKQWIAAIFGKNDGAKYSLTIDKQPGMNAIDFSSELILPAGYQIQETAGQNVAADNDKITYTTDLLKDGYYGIVAKK